MLADVVKCSSRRMILNNFNMAQISRALCSVQNVKFTIYKKYFPDAAKSKHVIILCHLLHDYFCTLYTIQNMLFLHTFNYTILNIIVQVLGKNSKYGIYSRVPFCKCFLKMFLLGFQHLGGLLKEITSC